MTQDTIMVKNNRDEILEGHLACLDGLTVDGALHVGTALIQVSLPTLNASQCALIAVNDFEGNPVGYIKVFPHS